MTFCWKVSLLSFVTALYEFPWQPVCAALNQKYLTVLGKSQFADMYFSLMSSLDGLCVQPADVIIGNQQLGDAVCPFSLLPQAEWPMRRLPLHDCQLSCRTHHAHFSCYPEGLVFY